MWHSYVWRKGELALYLKQSRDISFQATSSVHFFKERSCQGRKINKLRKVLRRAKNEQKSVHQKIDDSLWRGDPCSIQRDFLSQPCLDSGGAYFIPPFYSYYPFFHRLQCNVQRAFHSINVASSVALDDLSISFSRFPTLWAMLTFLVWSYALANLSTQAIFFYPSDGRGYFNSC